MDQITDTVLMIRPNSFRSNEETAVNNYFQHQGDDQSIQEKALKEFDEYVHELRQHDVNVIVYQADKDRDTPDELYPNNWISFHDDDKVVIYPMFAENRRRERDLTILNQQELVIERNWKITDYSSIEEHGMYLEGTGSMILDRQHRKAYCCLSPRSNEDVFEQFCKDFDFKPIAFKAFQQVGDNRELIYHANVMLSIGESFALICADSIDDAGEKEKVLQSLRSDEKEIITIREDQMEQFAGNILQLKNMKGERLIVMSAAAEKSLDEAQLNQISAHGKIVSVQLPTIEKYGGGSARCMLAEIF
tara:strand:+ start:62071 stop:62985 length:915 start_codon:yes stop_codon:yes gene_type:complete